MSRYYTLLVHCAQFIIILVGMGSIWCSAGHAATYRCEDVQGRVIYTDRSWSQKACHVLAETSTAPSAAPAENGAIYRIRHSDGRVTYTNHDASSTAADVEHLFDYSKACAACQRTSTIHWHSVPLQLDAYRESIRRAAAIHQLDTAYVRAIIHAESAFNPNALSHKGAQGLMQLMPATAAALGVTNAYDSDENIRGGSQYLAQLLRRYDGDMTLAAAAYHAGPHAVDRYAGVPPYPATQVYVERVRVLYARYLAAR